MFMHRNNIYTIVEMREVFKKTKKVPQRFPRETQHSQHHYHDGWIGLISISPAQLAEPFVT
jgi:hypothetical protein